MTSGATRRSSGATWSNFLRKSLLERKAALPNRPRPAQFVIPFSPQRANRRARVRGSASGLKNFTDRKSTRLNSSHLVISYAVFCLKKKKKKKHIAIRNTDT